MPLQIGEEWIDDAFIKEEIDRVKLDYQNRRLPLPADQDLDSLVKESIARRILLRREAEKRNIPCGEDEINSAVMQWRSEKKNVDHFANSSELRNYLRSRIMVDKLLDEVGRDHHPITEDHLNYFYKDNRDYYDQKIFYLVEEVAFFFKEKNNLFREKKSLLQEMEKEAKIFRDEFVALIKSFKSESEDSLNNFSSKVFAEAQKRCGDFFNTHFSVKHKNLGWHDDAFFHFVHNSDEVTPLMQFSKGLLFYVKSHATPGKNLDQEKMKWVLQRDLQTEVQKNNIDLFVKKLFEKTKIIDHKEF